MNDSELIEAWYTQPAREGDHPQAGRKRLIVPAPTGRIGTGFADPELAMIESMGPGDVFMMGDNPALPKMPERPRLLDFFRLRLNDTTIRHLTTSAKHALQDGHEEKVVMACLLHDLAMGAFIRADHGYWSAQMIAPYVSEEIAFAVKYHQPLRYFADESVGYDYPESYRRFFGDDYAPPDYIRRDAEHARAHRWYMTARFVTLNDVYILDRAEDVDLDMFEDIIGRHFREPEEGLGFDGSSVAHMWRTMIWPNNFL